MLGGLVEGFDRIQGYRCDAQSSLELFRLGSSFGSHASDDG